MRRLFILNVARWCTLICTGLSVITWCVLLAFICESPRHPDSMTGNVIPYACHAETVYITTFENMLIVGLIPTIFVLLFVLSFLSKKEAKKSAGQKGDGGN